MLRPLGVPLVLNDRVDVAKRVGADGVHVGQDDDSPARSRVSGLVRAPSSGSRSPTRHSSRLPTSDRRTTSASGLTSPPPPNQITLRRSVSTALACSSPRRCVRALPLAASTPAEPLPFAQPAPLVSPLSPRDLRKARSRARRACASRHSARGPPHDYQAEQNIHHRSHHGLEEDLHLAGGSDPDLRVPVREIALTGDEPPVRVYDASGPYTEGGAVDLSAGLPRVREGWLEARGHLESYEGRAVRPEDDGSPNASQVLPAVPGATPSAARQARGARHAARVRTRRNHHRRDGLRGGTREPRTERPRRRR